jgi:zinc and cadmium transporter
MTDLLQLTLLALLGSIIALIGGVVFLFNSRLSRVLEAYAIPFAAGSLITVSLVSLIPEAFEHAGERIFLIVLITFFVSYIFEHFIFVLHHHGDNKHHHHGSKVKSSVPLVIVGDTIHNFIDGIAIGAAFLVAPGLGLVTALSTFFHEIPHEIGDFGIMLKAGWSKNGVLTVNLLSALVTLPGAFFAYTFAGNDETVGMFLAISAGIFLYLGTIDFLPEVHENENRKWVALAPLVIGIIVMLAILIAVPHE